MPQENIETSNATEQDVEDTTTVEETKVPETVQHDKPDTTEAGKESNDSADDSNESDGLEHWKRMSRENEKAFKKAAKKLDDAEGQLAEARLKIKRMELQREHPELDDSLIDDMFTGSTSEELEQWAQKALKHFTKTDSKESEGKPTTDEGKEPAQGHRTEEPNSPLARAAAGIASQHVSASGSKPHRGEVYERKMKEFAERRKRLAGK